MKLDCHNCGAMVGHWLVVQVPGQNQFKCVCQKCGAVWRVNHHPLKDDPQVKESTQELGPEMVEAFGVQAPPRDYYLHSGHAWVALEDSGEVRVGLDAFSQKVLGPADQLRLPEVGSMFYQDHIFMAVIRKDNKASFEAPVDGMITEINPKVQQNPRLLYDDPYGEGWLFKIKPTNFQQNLVNLITGEDNTAWTWKEAHRLLHLMDSTVGATLPSGGTLVGDVFSHYPRLGWRRLVKEFFLTDVTRNWKKRA